MKPPVNILYSFILGMAAFMLSTTNSAADNRPDFSGIWTSYRQMVLPGDAQERGNLPLKPDARNKADAYRALVNKTGEHPGAWCLGAGMPGSMLGSGAYPMEIIQRPEQITVIFEAHQEIRRIYIGTDRFNKEDLFPDRNGYSEGHWEGDKLIVVTTQLKEQVDQTYAHSDQAQIIEEYYLTETEEGEKILTAEMTMTDQVFYEQPISTTKKWAFIPNGRLLPYECNEPAWEDRLEDLRQQAAIQSNQVDN